MKKTVLMLLIVLTGCYVSVRKNAVADVNTVLYPGTSVYYVEDDTLYYYGGIWYLFDNGEWYSGKTPDGPWKNLPASEVPSEVLDVHTMRFPPPPVVIEESPSLHIYPGTGVYYWSDGHLYQFGGFWYLYVDGIWYRSVSFAGPWIVIRWKEVPPPVIRVYRERPKIITRPRIIVDGTTRIEYIPNAHIYHYNGKWYYYRDGRWYVGNTWRGPWRIIRGGAPEIVIRTHRYRTTTPPKEVVPPRRVEPPRQTEPPRRTNPPGIEKKERRHR